MENTNEVTLKLNQKELRVLHAALCNRRGQVGELLGKLTELELATDDVDELWNLLGNLSTRMCDLMTD